MIIYLFGQPGSGKTTLAEAVAFHFHNNDFHKNIIIIDGDDMRTIFKNTDYSNKGRRVNIQKSHDIALFLSIKGYTVIIALVSPFADLRLDLQKKTHVKFFHLHTKEIRGRENFHHENIEINFDLDNKISTDTSVESTLLLIIRECFPG